MNLATQTELHGCEENPKPPLPHEIAGHFPQLEIVECLGRGGMGVVYKARQPQLNRWVALKILAPEKERDSRFAERFQREAQALAQLNHPNIVTVYDFGQANGLYYLLMEYVDGASLRQLLQTNQLTPEKALTIVPPICEALQYAHDHGIIHRDIKPENILLDQQGRVKIADFGIARMLGSGFKQGAATEVHEVMGTPQYMAPEQTEQPSQVDHRADIYSLGVIIYEMLTGELPRGKFDLPSEKAEIDARLDEVVLRALEKDRERRYQQASQVKSDVETIAAHHPGIRTPATNPATASVQDRAEAQKQLRAPALGLAVSSISGPFMLGFLVQQGRLTAGAWMFWPLVIELILTVVAAYGALKAKRVESYSSAMAGGIAGCLVSFLNLFCLPFAIWLLAVLTRPQVKRAFFSPGTVSEQRMRAAGQTDSNSRSHRAKSGMGEKHWLYAVAGALLLLLLAWGSLDGFSGLRSNHHFSAGAELEGADRSKVLRLPGDGPEEVADFSHRLITSKDLESMSRQPHLKRLDLHDSSISEEGLAVVANLRDIEWLDLSATLEETRYKPRITDADLRMLALMPRLRFLNLHGHPITDAGLEHLRNLSLLEKLQLGKTLVRGEGLQHLPNLKWLRLDASPVTDEGLRYIQTITGLEQLYLCDTEISDAGLTHLADLVRLKELVLDDTKVTPVGLSSLKRALPFTAMRARHGKQSAEFLPARTVRFGNRKLLQDCFLEAESGRLLSLPHSVSNSLAAKNQWHPGGMLSVSSLLEWLRSNRVDFVARKGSDGLTLVDGAGLLSGANSFNSVKADQVRRGAKMLAETLAAHTNRQPEGLSMYWFDPRGEERLWIFRTRTGLAGVLEIIESGGNWGPMKIRYKLAMSEEAASGIEEDEPKD